MSTDRLALLPTATALMLWAVPATFALGAWMAGRAADSRPTWRASIATAGAALLAAALAAAAMAVQGAGAAAGVRLDGAGALVLLLVCALGLVVLRYSRTYLDGEARQPAYLRWLLAALAAVSLVIVTNHLLVLALAWMGTGLALHRLLTFYADRPAARIAAHKKFICSRAADLSLFCAVALIGATLDTLRIDEAIARAAALPALPPSLHLALVLVALTALLKCAQLPFHGWLIQVMEAPTPVSALLHAGVVNLGGLVLIRLSPLVAQVPAAQALLVVVGSATAVLAALVMTTRISIKVQLAWSTCAQMGFMLMQCGLGAWEMALLHLLAHSLYKAHAFLGAGTAVRASGMRQMTAAGAEPGPARLVAGLALALAMTAAGGAIWGVQPAATPALWVLALIVALALAPMLSTAAAPLGALRWLALPAGALAIALAYFGLHAIFVPLVPAADSAVSPWLLAWVVACFGLLFVVQAVMRLAPEGALARTLYPWFYGGGFLDERFSRIVFRLWPLPPALPTPTPTDETPAAVRSIAGAL